MGSQSRARRQDMETLSMFVEEIERNGRVFAIILRDGYEKKGVDFFSDKEHPLQLGVHIRGKGTEIRPHTHRPLRKLENIPLQEAFYVVYGEVQVDLYDGSAKFTSTILKKGDTILLTMGGHGVKFLKDTKMIEIKQGPYRGTHEEKEFI